MRPMPGEEAALTEAEATRERRPACVLYSAHKRTCSRFIFCSRQSPLPELSLSLSRALYFLPKEASLLERTARCKLDSLA